MSSSPQTASHDYDVIIIGAGLSALQAARTIQREQPNSSILLLEARDRVGGRAHTLTGQQKGVDVGCSMLHGYYQGNPGRKLLNQLAIDVHIPQGAAKGLVYGDEGPLKEADANSLFSQSTQMAFKPNPDQTENGVSVASLLFPTLLREDKEVGERLIAIARTGEIGAGIELEKTSAKWAGYEKGIGGTDAWPIGGYSSVVDKLVTDYESHGGHLQLSQIVTSLTDDPSSKTVKLTTTTRSKQPYTSRYVISTIPLSVLQKSPPTFSPPLTPSLRSAISRTLVGNLEKIVLTYSSAWWPHASTQHSYLLLPLSTASHPPSSSATAPPPKSLNELFERTTIPIINFNSSLSCSPHPTLLAYIGAVSARHLSQYSSSEIASSLHSYLISRFSPTTSSPPPPIASHVTSWSTDPFSLGATSTPTTLTKSEPNGDTWSNPLDFVSLGRSEWEGRLGFAGEHTVLDNHGSVTGALESGRREGERVGLKLEADERERIK